MAEYETKEKATGIWSETGEEVEFNRFWAGHRFSDDEVSKLLAGETVELRDLKNKNGKKYGVTGKLENLEYNGHEYVGFNRIGFIDLGEVPDEWCKHKFNKAEKTALLAGNSIEIKGAVSKAGNKFDCRVRFTKRDDGRMGIVIDKDTV